MSEPRIEDQPIEPDAGGAEAAPVARPVGRLAIWGVSAAVIGVFLAVDFITPDIPDDAPLWQAAFCGIGVGQVSLIATWAVLAPGNLIVRLPWSLLLAAAMWHALVLGGREFCGLTLETALVLGASLLVGMIIAQVPLWIAKRVFRWRLIRGADVPVQVEQGPWQFTLQHLLLATFLLAVALAPIRKVLPPGPVVRFPPGLGELFVDLAIALVSDLLISVPCTWGALYISRAATLSLLSIGALWVVALLVLSAIFGLPFHPAAGLLLCIACQGVTVFGTLLIYRALGFRLVRAALQKPDREKKLCPTPFGPPQGSGKNNRK